MKAFIFALLLASGTTFASTPTMVCQDLGEIVQFEQGDLLGAPATLFVTRTEQFTYNFLFRGDIKVKADLVGRNACFNHEQSKFCVLDDEQAAHCIKVIIEFDLKDSELLEEI